MRRDGQGAGEWAGDVVKDDCVLMAAGEAVVADGTVLEARYLEVDELCSPENPTPVRRDVGDRLLSGSVCVAGEGRLSRRKSRRRRPLPISRPPGAPLRLFRQPADPRHQSRGASVTLVALASSCFTLSPTC